MMRAESCACCPGLVYDFISREGARCVLAHRQQEGQNKYGMPLSFPHADTFLSSVHCLVHGRVLVRTDALRIAVAGRKLFSIYKVRFKSNLKKYLKEYSVFLQCPRCPGIKESPARPHRHTKRRRKRGSCGAPAALTDAYASASIGTSSYHGIASLYAAFPAEEAFRPAQRQGRPPVPPP